MSNYSENVKKLEDIRKLVLSKRVTKIELVTICLQLLADVSNQYKSLEIVKNVVNKEQERRARGEKSSTEKELHATVKQLMVLKSDIETRLANVNSDKISVHHLISLGVVSALSDSGATAKEQLLAVVLTEKILGLL